MGQWTNDFGKSTGLLLTAKNWVASKKHSNLCSKLLSDIGQPNCSTVCLGISEVAVAKSVLPTEAMKDQETVVPR